MYFLFLDKAWSGVVVGSIIHLEITTTYSIGERYGFIPEISRFIPGFIQIYNRHMLCLQPFTTKQKASDAYSLSWGLFLCKDPYGIMALSQENSKTLLPGPRKESGQVVSGLGTTRSLLWHQPKSPNQLNQDPKWFQPPGGRIGHLKLFFPLITICKY